MMQGSNDVPHLGSPEPIERGCTCPIFGNGSGVLWEGKHCWWMTEGCPLYQPLSKRESTHD